MTVPPIVRIPTPESYDLLYSAVTAALGGPVAANLAGLPAASGYSGKQGIALDTGAVYKSNGTTWGSPIGFIATPSYVQTIASMNMLPDGGNLKVAGAGLKRRLLNAAYTAPVIGQRGPLGGDSVGNASGTYAAWISYPDVMPLPSDGGGVKVRVWGSFYNGHSNQLRINPIKANGVELYGAESRGTTLPYNLPVAGTTVVVVAGISVTWNYYDFTFTPDWPSDCVGFDLSVGLNLASAAGQSWIGAIAIIPASASFPKENVLPSPTARGGMAERDIVGDMYAPDNFVIPTEASRWSEWGFDSLPVGALAKINNYYATRDPFFLEACIPLIDAVIAVRDDKRSTPRQDFDGTVRKAWSTNQFQTTSDTDMWLPIDLNATPPHPEAYIHFPLHQGLTTYTILSWIEAVLHAKYLSTNITSKVAGYLAACLETLHEFDSQYAYSTHATNNDPSPMVAGEGRYFMKWNSSTTSKDGWSYIPGGVETPINQDAQMAAALYVAYRVMRQYGPNPDPTKAAEAAEFKNKADSIMRRLKRMTYWYEGALGWYYTRPGTWHNTAWNNATPANNPYALGHAHIAVNPRTESNSYGEDWDHVSITLRAVGEYAKTSGGIFTQEDLVGMARTISRYYWSDSIYMRSYFQPTPEKGWTTTTSASSKNIVGNVPQGLVWITGYEPTLRGLMLAWYATALTPRRMIAGALRVHGLL